MIGDQLCSRRASRSEAFKENDLKVLVELLDSPQAKKREVAVG